MKFQVSIAHGTYHAGDVVSGTVECWRTRRFTTYGCQLELCGVEQTRSRVGSTAAFSVESKQFLSCKVTLGRVAGPSLASYWFLEAGQHVWPFQIQLPADMPPSVAHPSGCARIVYEVRAHMVVPGDRDGKSFVQFNVISVPRLRVLQPKMVERVAEKSFGLQSNEPLLIRVQLQKDVYAPGDLLKLKFFVDNASRKTLNGFRFEIVCTWRLGKQSITETVAAAEFAPSDSFPLQPRAIVQTVAGCRLPSAPLTQSVAGQLLSCSYKLLITAALSGIATRDIKIELPFVVVAEIPQAPPSPRVAAESRQSVVAPADVPPPAYPPKLALPGADAVTVRRGSADLSQPPPAPVKLGDKPIPPAPVRLSDAQRPSLPSAPPQSRRVSSTSSAVPRIVETHAEAPSVAWIDDDDWVKIDDRDVDGVLDLAENAALPPYNPELGVLHVPDVAWGVTPRASPSGSPRVSPSGSPRASPSASPTQSKRSL
jgi:hypothetical protein